jgi:hypothetical protein
MAVSKGNANMRRLDRSIALRKLKEKTKAKASRVVAKVQSIPSKLRLAAAARDRRAVKRAGIRDQILKIEEKVYFKNQELLKLKKELRDARARFRKA